jgi:hypothetical protein
MALLVMAAYLGHLFTAAIEVTLAQLRRYRPVAWSHLASGRRSNRDAQAKSGMAVLARDRATSHRAWSQSPVTAASQPGRPSARRTGTSANSPLPPLTRDPAPLVRCSASEQRRLTLRD